MSALLFKLRNVPEDEADEIRALMGENNIDVYETNAGNWGISMPGIWVQHDEDLAKGKALIVEYQQQRAITARETYDEDKRMGRIPNLWQAIAKRPLPILGILLFCLFVVYAMLSPFIRLAANS